MFDAEFGKSECSKMSECVLSSYKYVNITPFMSIEWEIKILNL